jgi:hypothetical protein
MISSSYLAPVLTKFHWAQGFTPPSGRSSASSLATSSPTSLFAIPLLFSATFAYTPVIPGFPNQQGFALRATTPSLGEREQKMKEAPGSPRTPSSASTFSAARVFPWAVRKFSLPSTWRIRKKTCPLHLCERLNFWVPGIFPGTTRLFGPFFNRFPWLSPTFHPLFSLGSSSRFPIDTFLSLALVVTPNNSIALILFIKDSLHVVMFEAHLPPSFFINLVNPMLQLTWTKSFYKLA